MVSYKLAVTMHQAREVGYELMFYKSMQGLEFSLSGLSDKNIIYHMITIIIESK